MEVPQPLAVLDTVWHKNDSPHIFNKIQLKTQDRQTHTFGIKKINNIDNKCHQKYISGMAGEIIVLCAVVF